ncbi:hypothetical protein LIER_08495 [Lithospermum erythrorhizon]|uniref:Uncharacterized protein n=1 Tax=Lithospermum erythrorhizon TaxID=34254 RepID=A0AAV3PEZ0_LITER
MESTEEASFHKVQPPRLEDAGLEDCALPPEAIHEAFLKAAMSTRPIISDSDDDEDDDEEEKNEHGVVKLDVLDKREACVDGLHGLKIADQEVDNIMGNKFKDKNDGNEDEDNESVNLH